MEELEKTCENCKYEFEDMEGTHCRHCIHSAEERFEPKVIVPTEAEIRAKAIDEFATYMSDYIYENQYGCVDDLLDRPYTTMLEIAEQMRGE